MGKTTFCLNYVAHAQRKFPKLNIALVSLAGTDFEQHIKSIGNKSDTVLLADAFDEDPLGWGRGRARLNEFLLMVEDFHTVIITCRSQYFISDDAIPRETEISVIVPRKLGQAPSFSLVRSYISPFSPEEISRYIDKHFPLLYFWRWKSRFRARQLVESVPDLAYRPMLLEKLPELAREPATSKEIYDLYDILVEGWIQREKGWISKDNLRVASFELAILMFKDFATRRGRLEIIEIEWIAVEKFGRSPDWSQLTSRSLLNRDSAGHFKFAHKSIMEFLVVKAACGGDDRAFTVEWTEFMKELFISWGHSSAGRGHWARAQEMLRSQQGRSNIAPLCDMLDFVAVRGLPDFQRCAERRKTSTGIRIAPASWRASSIDVYNKGGKGVVSVYDAEFNLQWTYIPSRTEGVEDLPVRVVDALHFLDRSPQYRLPSYEQFVCLIEGLYRVARDLLPAGPLFLIADKPAKREQLLVQINSPATDNDYIKAVDRRRRINGTGVYINCYETGIKIAPAYSTGVLVEQLYIDENAPRLL
jgi:hypothetical protein